MYEMGQGRLPGGGRSNTGAGVEGCIGLFQNGGRGQQSRTEGRRETKARTYEQARSGEGMGKKAECKGKNAV